MAKKKIDESLLIEMAAKGFAKRPKPQTVTKTPREDKEVHSKGKTENTKVIVSSSIESTVAAPVRISPNDIATYQEVFLKNTVYTDRITQALNRETLDLLKNIVAYTGTKISVAALVENILRQHLIEYRDLLNELTAPNIPKQVIPKL